MIRKIVQELVKATYFSKALNDNDDNDYEVNDD